MRLVYLAHADASGPSSRYRIHQYRHHFAAAGVDLEVLPAFDRHYFEAEGRTPLTRGAQRLLAGATALARRVGQLRRALAADGVVIEREFFPRLPPIAEWLIAQWGPGYVLELDDAIYLSRGRRRSYGATLGLARRVIAGNATLAAHCAGSNADVRVVPTTIELDRYPVRSDYTLASPPRIGWVGLASNLHHLTGIAPALAAVCAHLGATVVVVSARAPEWDVPTTFVPWSERDEAAVVRSFDVGIMPLLDTPFARGKCGLKLLQYMAAGVPAVGSPVGVNAVILADGAGLIADTQPAWVAALESVLTDAALRAGLGRAGRAQVERGYACATWGPTLVAALTEPFSGARGAVARSKRGR